MPENSAIVIADFGRAFLPPRLAKKDVVIKIICVLRTSTQRHRRATRIFFVIDNFGIVPILHRDELLLPSKTGQQEMYL